MCAQKHAKVRTLSLQIYGKRLKKARQQDFLKHGSFVEGLKKHEKKAVWCLQYFIQGLCVIASQNAFCPDATAQEYMGVGYMVNNFLFSEIWVVVSTQFLVLAFRLHHLEEQVLGQGLVERQLEKSSDGISDCDF